MNYVEHAEQELRRVGMYDADADYGAGSIADCVLDIMRVFAEQGHSGGSAMLTIDLVEKLMRYEPLSPLTSDPDEWMDVSEASGVPMWQNRRCGTCFSEDGGQTWYDLDGKYGVHVSKYYSSKETE